MLIYIRKLNGRLKNTSADTPSHRQNEALQTGLQYANIS